MDTTFTVGELAEITGATPPTIRRVLGDRAARTSGGHRRTTIDEAQRVVDEVGITPRIEGLTPSEVRVLAALARSPQGLRSGRAAARASGVAPTTASQALRSLAAKKFTTSSVEQVAAGRVTEFTIWRLQVDDRWFDVAPDVLRTRPPAHTRSVRNPTRVPRRFWHLFWTGDPAELRLPDDAVFVARRLIESDDLTAAGWAVSNLPPQALHDAAHARGWTPETRALALNAAEHG
ncbi:MAG: MarR family transcriptional regulator [Acidimicrobiia bacterium]|nr:MarR family transcriptional regulator [Acidimicrobiia bacterium]